MGHSNEQIALKRSQSRKVINAISQACIQRDCQHFARVTLGEHLETEVTDHKDYRKTCLMAMVERMWGNCDVLDQYTAI